MIRNKKLERALYGPSVFEVTLGAILSIALGVVIAAAYLISKPVQAVPELPKEADRVQGQVYYVEGSKDPGKGKQWMRKRQMLVDSTPGEIVFTEEELNAWLSAGAPAAKKPAPKPAAKPAPAPAKDAKAAPGSKAPAAPAAPEGPPAPLFELGVPNVRIRDSVMQVGVPATISVLGVSMPVIAQAQGGFEKRDDMFMYVPNTLLIGSLPLNRIPGATDFLIKRVLASQAIPEEALNLWKHVSNVVVDGRNLKVTLP